MKEEFLNLLRQVKREGIDDLIQFIEKTDFFKAPASIYIPCLHIVFL